MTSISSGTGFLKGALRSGFFKPSNILLDNAGRPYVADFGLALKDENFGHGPHFVGTPIYMSPEQARGEGDRVDGRSDIFSLGIVIYKLLTGRCPFHGSTPEELLDQIASREIRPPVNGTIQSPRTWSVSVLRHCLSELRIATQRPRTWPAIYAISSDAIDYQSVVSVAQ